MGSWFEQEATRKIILWKELIYGRKFTWQLPLEVRYQNMLLQGVFT